MLVRLSHFPSSSEPTLTMICNIIGFGRFSPSKMACQALGIKIAHSQRLLTLSAPVVRLFSAIVSVAILQTRENLPPDVKFT